MRAGVFVTGTDTGIGKTVVSACLVRRWAADYWKPVQTGLAGDPSDSLTVAQLAGAPASRIHPPRHVFQAPLSPEAAAAAEGASVALTDFELPGTGGTASPIVVEGAGGVLVPLGGGALMTDLMGRLGLPVLLVARTGLGTINHTLLSLEVLRARGLVVWGVVMVGQGGADNAEAIARLGQVAILAHLAPMPDVTAAAVTVAAAVMPAAPPWPQPAGRSPSGISDAQSGRRQSGPLQPGDAQPGQPPSENTRPGHAKPEAPGCGTPTGDRHSA